MSDPYSVVLFDGICNFCSQSVHFIIQHDPMKRFKFASLQSEVGRKYLTSVSNADQLDSIVLIEKGKYYFESDAVLRISKHLQGLWKVFYVFIFFPKPCRDFAYRWFAKRRYRFFGKQDYCMVPSKEIRERFLTE